MRTAFLLAFRLHHAELIAVALASVGLAVLEIWVAGQLDAILAGCRAAAEMVAPCGGPEELGMIYDNATSGPMYLGFQGLAILPFAAGVVLGVPLVAREIEHGTAQVAWPLARSRTRWLALRALPVALIGVAVLVIPAMAGEIVIRSLYPGFDPATNFEGYGIRGPLLILRFLPAFAAAALVGVWIGRQLPAILLAGAVVAGIGIGLMQVRPLWVEPVEQAQVDELEPIDFVGNLYVRTRYRDADGEWMRDEDAWAILGQAYEDTNQAGLPEEVFFVIPRERYLDVVARESIALVAGGVLVSGLLVLTVRRRRPG